MFTACQKETLLETNPKTNPTNITSSKTNITNELLMDEEMMASFELDAADSAAIASSFLKTTKNAGNGDIAACYNNTPNPDQCGNSFKYSSCQFALEMWNDRNNLYLDFDFSSQLVGTRRDCNGRTCNYWLVPYLQLNLYNDNGVKIGVVNLSTSTISTKSKTFTINIASLASYGNVACVSVSGYFKGLKQCSGGCGGSYGSIQCVGTYCVSNNACQLYCLQICTPPPPACATVTNVTIDKSSLCGSGTVKADVVITGDVTKTTTTWTVEGRDQVITGTSVNLNFSENTTCAPVVKKIHSKVICNDNQTVLHERDFVVTINPVYNAEIVTDNYFCTTQLLASCNDIESNTIWTLGENYGTGSTAPTSSIPSKITFTVTKYGCTYVFTKDDVICFSLLKGNNPTEK